MSSLLSVGLHSYTTYQCRWINKHYKHTKRWLQRILTNKAKRIVLLANHESITNFKVCLCFKLARARSFIM